MNYYERLHNLFATCLFEAEESMKGAVFVDGVLNRYGFHPKRLEESKEAIVALANEMVSDKFRVNGGGGYSLMALPFDRNDQQWGEQRDADILACLCVAVGVASYAVPRTYWGMLPGGMPYLVFDLPAGGVITHREQADQAEAPTE